MAPTCIKLYITSKHSNDITPQQCIVCYQYEKDAIMYMSAKQVLLERLTTIVDLHLQLLSYQLLVTFRSVLGSIVHPRLLQKSCQGDSDERERQQYNTISYYNSSCQLFVILLSQYGPRPVIQNSLRHPFFLRHPFQKFASSPTKLPAAFVTHGCFPSSVGLQPSATSRHSPLTRPAFQQRYASGSQSPFLPVFATLGFADEEIIPDPPSQGSCI